MTTPTLIEETWWDVLTTTGLALRMPAPLSSMSCPGVVPKSAPEPLSPKQALYEAREMDRPAIESKSAITGMTYALDLSQVLFIQVFTRKDDPERLVKAQMKAAGLSPTSSTSGLAATSPSDAPASRSGRSTGARIKRGIH